MPHEPSNLAILLMAYLPVAAEIGGSLGPSPGNPPSDADGMQTDAASYNYKALVSTLAPLATGLLVNLISSAFM